MMLYSQLGVLGVILPKTKDGYEVKVGDLVWCKSDPFVPVFITLIHPFTPKVVGEKEFTFWVDPRDDEGDYPADDNEVFGNQKNCLLAARKKLYGDISSFHTSVKSHRKQIHLIDNFLHGEK